MAIVVKQIKPARLKVDAMRLELLNPMRDIGKEIKDDFELTTASWTHKPAFEVVRAIASVGGTVEVMVATDDEVYTYVDKGTRPHIIRAKNGKRLAFQWAGPGSYRAKTAPGVLGSTSGGASGEMVYPMVVHHPGTKARNFDVIIQKKWQPRFKQRMEYAMKKVAKASGHGG